MVPPPQKIVILDNLKVSAVPHPRRSSGVVNYTAVVVDQSIAETYIHFPPKLDKSYGGEMIAFFAAAITTPLSLEAHLPHVLLELIACAKHLGKSHNRGALTNGFEWHFIAMDLDADGEGAKYWVSQLVQWRTQQSPTSSEQIVEPTDNASDPALIAAILSSW
ncbi:hypothetical protein DXG03_008229, partial [Asterophora parasitica]